MSDGTKIEWTDATINVINGCTVVSPGCKHCYAMKQAHRFPVRQGLTRKTAGGMVWTGEVRLHTPPLGQLIRWKRPRRLFWNAHGDTFHENVPVEWIDLCFAAMLLSPQHVHQVLTKRPERMRDYINDPQTPFRVGAAVGELVRLDLIKGASIGKFAWPLPNVWLGVSVEDQQRANERIPLLLDTMAAIRWLSMEPLLGPVDLGTITLRAFGALPNPLSSRLGDYVQPLVGNFTDSPRINWIVLGGESGPKARPMDPRWARSIRDQCAAADVPFLMKQWGEWGHPRPPIRFAGDPAGSHRKVLRGHFRGREVPVHQFNDGSSLVKIGKAAAGRLLDGVEHNGYPA